MRLTDETRACSLVARRIFITHKETVMQFILHVKRMCDDVLFVTVCI
jgi:hypothetical protein